MSRQEEDINALLTNLNKTVDQSQRRPEEVLYTRDNLSPFKSNQAWPGRDYILVGNSYNVERRIIDTTCATRRIACIAVVLERGRTNRKCVSIEDAFTVPGFVECLSRFEYEWLKKQPPSTLIGPAYDQDGNFVKESFAVWRRESAYKAVLRADRHGVRAQAGSRRDL